MAASARVAESPARQISDPQQHLVAAQPRPPCSKGRRSALPPLLCQCSPSRRPSSTPSITTTRSAATPSSHRRRLRSSSRYPTRGSDASDYDRLTLNPPPDLEPLVTVDGSLYDSATQNSLASSFADADTDAEFSSQPSYPSFVEMPSPESADLASPQPHPTPTSHLSGSLLTSQATTQSSFLSTIQPQDSLFSIDFGDDGQDEDTQISAPDLAPYLGLGHGSEPDLDDDSLFPAAKRRRLSASQEHKQAPALLELPHPVLSDDDPFADAKHPDKPADDEALSTIDLTEADEAPNPPQKADVDKRVKLSAFQCVICMDDATTLTVTHCGHLYCQECLHSSLHVEVTKGKCPMCRAKIDMKSRPAYNTKTKGFWPLELKLMTATKKGKRKADDIS